MLIICLCFVINITWQKQELIMTMRNHNQHQTIKLLKAQHNTLPMASSKYFNKGVKALNDPNVGFVVRETPDKIVVFGEKNERHDVPLKENSTGWSKRF